MRNYAGGLIRRGGVFVGTAGGHLLAIDLVTGIVGWDATVANPKGATELERIADVTSLPLVLEKDVVCGRLPGTRRVLRNRTRHADSGRVTSRA